MLSASGRALWKRERAMRRADRLFQIIQVLRRTRKPLTADAIAAELETSKRTIYRDIATLIEQRVPIRGEAGMGYILEKGFDLPPLMLTPDEIEAAVLGAQWVAAMPTPCWRAPPQDLMAKIADTVPERLAALRAGARKPRPPGLAPRARPHRHGADARADPRGQEDHAELSRRARPRQPAHDLADRDRLSRSGAAAGGVVRTAQGFSQFSHRPRRRRGVPRREISGAARPVAGEMAAEPGLGGAEGYRDRRVSREARFPAKRPMDNPTIAIESPCQACGACCSYSQTGRASPPRRTRRST